LLDSFSFLLSFPAILFTSLFLLRRHISVFIAHSQPSMTRSDRAGVTFPPSIPIAYLLVFPHPASLFFSPASSCYFFPSFSKRIFFCFLFFRMRSLFLSSSDLFISPPLFYFERTVGFCPMEAYFFFSQSDSQTPLQKCGSVENLFSLPLPSLASLRG